MKRCFCYEYKRENIIAGISRCLNFIDYTLLYLRGFRSWIIIVVMLQIAALSLRISLKIFMKGNKTDETV